MFQEPVSLFVFDVHRGPFAKDRTADGSAIESILPDCEGLTAEVMGVSDATVLGQIVFAEDVASGETAVLTYEGVHARLANETDVVTLPKTHLEAIIAFVDFRAHWERESTETYTGSSSSLILSQLGENGRRAWNRYKEILASQTSVGGWSVEHPSWGDWGL